MDIKSAKFDVKATCGEKFLLTGIRPAYAYVNGTRAPEPHGHTYSVVLPERRYAELEVAIEGPPLMEAPENVQEVRFAGLELQVKWSPLTKGDSIAGVATGIIPVPAGKA